MPLEVRVSGGKFSRFTGRDAKNAEARRATQSPCCSLRNLCALSAFAVKTATPKALIGCRYSEPLDSHFQWHPGSGSRKPLADTGPEYPVFRL
jgi:hypothetical protein